MSASWYFDPTTTVVAANAVPPASATFGITDDDDTVVTNDALGSVAVSAASTITEETDGTTLTAELGPVPLNAEATITEEDDGRTLEALVAHVGTSGGIEGDDTISSRAEITVQGQAGGAEDDDTVSATGLPLPELHGAATQQEDGDELESYAGTTSAVSASLSATEGQDTLTCRAGGPSTARRAGIPTDDVDYARARADDRVLMKVIAEFLKEAA